MFKRLARQRKSKLQDQLAQTDAKLALMNAQLAAQMIKLARQTEDLAPLAQAEEALTAARRYYTYETTPIEIGLVQTALGDTLMDLGRVQSDKPAIDRARKAYRAAITLASMRGDDVLRDELRDKVKITESLLGRRPAVPSLFKVA